MTITLKPVHIALIGGVIIGLFIAGAVAVAMGGGDDGSEPTAQVVPTVTSATAVPTTVPPTAVPPTATPPPPPPSEPEPEPQPQVRSCGEIRATGYNNDAERAFFLSSCNTQPSTTQPTPRPAAPAAAPPAPAAPPANTAAADEARYRQQATSIVFAFSVRLTQWDTHSYGVANDALDKAAVVRNFSHEMGQLQPVPPRFRQAHDRLIAAANLYAGHLVTVETVDVDNVVAWLGRFETLADTLIAALNDFALVVGIKL